MRKFKKYSALLAASFLILLLLTTIGIRKSRQNENTDFLKFTNNLFCRELSGNTIALHYTLKNPSAFGITDTPVCLGAFSTDSLSVCTALENAQAILESFDYSKLSSKNQLTYDILNRYYETALHLAPFTLYEEPLAPLTGTQAQLPLILSEYQFYNSSDIDTYLELVKKVPGYFDSLLNLESVRADNHFSMSETALHRLLEECRAFLSPNPDHYLYSSFDERLQKLTGLSEKQVAKYKKKNASYLKKYVFPSYKKLMTAVRHLHHSSVSKGLAHIPHGREYYEALVAGETGSSHSITELQKLTRAQLRQDLIDLQKAIKTHEIPDPNIPAKEPPIASTPSPTSDFYSPQSVLLPDTNPLAILTTLQKHMRQAFPLPLETDIQVKYVQKSMEDFFSPAFYMIPAIDNTHSNVIYINSGHLPNDLSLFTTLAHEGYPGHLYQNVYYMNQSPDPIRCLLNFGGYTEGWATYAEMLSYYYAPISRIQATILQKNASVMLGLYALADMGIHYDGWKLSDTAAFFRKYGILDEAAVSEIYELIVADPSNYLKYYIGYVEFLELKKYAIQTWKDDFSQKRFHGTVLRTGPAPFDILRKQITKQMHTLQ